MCCDSQVEQFPWLPCHHGMIFTLIRISGKDFAYCNVSIVTADLVELLWPKALEVDRACRFAREAIIRIADARKKRRAQRVVGFTRQHPVQLL